MEGKLDVTGIECGSFNKGKVVLACELLGLLCWHSPQMPQIALVSHQHDDDIRVRVVPQLLQPPGYILVRLVLADVVDEQGADRSAVVC